MSTSANEPSARQAQQRRLDIAIGFLSDILGNWNEDDLDHYPTTLLSFDELIAEMRTIRFVPESKESPDNASEAAPAWSGDREGPAFFTELYQAD